MKVIIAAAGTGGHINPGIAIANEIKKHHKNAEITFIGTPRGLENDLVPRSGYKLKTIDAYGIKREISFQNLRNICKTLKSYRTTKKIVKQISPDIIIGTGGYICGPVLSSGEKLKIPTLLHESNAFPGIAVKVLSKKTDTVLVGFEEAKKRLPKAKNVVVTGTPTKVNKIHLNDKQKADIKKQFKIENKLPIVVIFGGSQGAESINRCLIEIINNLKIFTPLSLFISNIFNCNVEIINAIINGIFEITRGCKDLSVLQLNEFFVGVLTCFIISFGGIATNMQGLTFLSKFEMKTSFFIKQKITHAIFSTLVCALLLIIF